MSTAKSSARTCLYITFLFRDKILSLSKPHVSAGQPASLDLHFSSDGTFERDRLELPRHINYPLGPYLVDVRPTVAREMAPRFPTNTGVCHPDRIPKS